MEDSRDREEAQVDDATSPSFASPLDVSFDAASRINLDEGSGQARCPGSLSIIQSDEGATAPASNDTLDPTRRRHSTSSFHPTSTHRKLPHSVPNILYDDISPQILPFVAPNSTIPYDLTRPGIFQNPTLESFDVFHQIAICSLCALGARCSSESGVLAAHVDPTDPSSTVGGIRDAICESLIDYAWALKCGSTFPSVPTTMNERELDRLVKTLMGLMYALSTEDERPDRCRTILECFVDIGVSTTNSSVIISTMLQTPQQADAWLSVSLDLRPLVPPLSPLDTLFESAELLAALSEKIYRLEPQLIPAVAVLDDIVATSANFTSACERRFGTLMQRRDRQGDPPFARTRTAGTFLLSRPPRLSEPNLERTHLQEVHHSKYKSVETSVAGISDWGSLAASDYPLSTLDSLTSFARPQTEGPAHAEPDLDQLMEEFVEVSNAAEETPSVPS
ncbi:hypothetical protein P7C70_g1394, partial [Phenoliferia sp. Uapishka_3]